MITCCKHVICFSAEKTCTHRNTAGDSLGQRHYFRVETELIAGEQRAAPSYACLHFISHDNSAGFSRLGGSCLCPRGVNNVYSAFALHAFYEKRRSCIVKRGFYRVPVICLYCPEAVYVRSKTCRMEFFLSRCRERCYRASVKRLFERIYDMTLFSAVHVSVFACKLDRGFVSLCAAVPEVAAGKSCSFKQFIGKCKSLIGEIIIRNMYLAGSLLLYRLYKRSVCMTEAVHADACDKIDVLSTAGVIQRSAFSLYEHSFKTAVIINNFLFHNRSLSCSIFPQHSKFPCI